MRGALSRSLANAWIGVGVGSTTRFFGCNPAQASCSYRVVIDVQRANGRRTDPKFCRTSYRLRSGVKEPVNDIQDSFSLINHPERSITKANYRRVRFRKRCGRLSIHKGANLAILACELRLTRAKRIKVADGLSEADYGATVVVKRVRIVSFGKSQLG